MTYEELKREQSYQAKIQEMLNLRHRRNGAVQKAALVFHAERLNRRWPQYRGHWDGEGWEVRVVNQDVTTKMGVAFRAGDVTLVKREASFGTHSMLVAFSFRNNVDTAI